MRAFILFLYSALLTTGFASPACYSPIPERVFDQHYRIIAGTRGEGERLEMSRQLVRNNCVATWQVAELMDLFEHDGNRLELGRSAYPSVVDPENYLSLTDLLEDPGHRQELYRWVNNQGNGGPPAHAPAYGYRKKHDDDDHRGGGKKRKYDDDDDYRSRDDDDRGYQERPVYAAAPVRVEIRIFNDVIIAIRRERYMERRLAMAQSYVSQSPTTTQEVVFIMRELGDDRVRMQFAQFAYGYVRDPQAYTQVIGSLESTRYQAEMRAWMRR
ncbi:MAG: DUF4476 domain-containing protein [Bacteroidia bacterium]|nr:DUF4476 domain-containing protein [Bacteroidia bacterium]